MTNALWKKLEALEKAAEDAASQEARDLARKGDVAAFRGDRLYPRRAELEAQLAPKLLAPAELIEWREWQAKRAEWMKNMQLGWQAFVREVQRIVPEWGDGDERWGSLMVRLCKLTGLQPESFGKLTLQQVQMFVREAAKYQLEEAKAKVSSRLASVNSLPRLDETDELAAKFIRENPGETGKKVAKAAGVTEPHFRRKVVPKLKKHGFTGTRGSGGYYPPDYCQSPA